MEKNVNENLETTDDGVLFAKLNKGWGFGIRSRAADYLQENLNTRGAQRGTDSQQGYGVLAQMTIRNLVRLPELTPDDHPLGYDVLLPSGVKADVKCRGGEKKFRTHYTGTQEIPREAKHNFFARQIHDESLDSDIFILTHLEHPKTPLPGKTTERKWKLYICGWVSKERVFREGVYLPPKALTEQGMGWFGYHYHEIEFYQKNLRPIHTIHDLGSITPADVEADKKIHSSPNLASIDILRIAEDLVGKGILTKDQVLFLRRHTGITATIPPFLHPNQYYHLLRWLVEEGQADQAQIQKLATIMQETPFEGLE